MEIRNALQKIENYLTVVSNLNRTILSEGTMSRDELLLMKKYLYTSIDRIEDIEKSLIIDKKDEKSFTPNQMEAVQAKPIAKQKEIVEVDEVSNLEEIEAELDKEPEIQDSTIQEIIAETNVEQNEMVGKIISSLTDNKETNVEVVSELPKEEEKLDLVVSDENIITEDFVVDKVVEEKLDLVAPVENIITEDFVVDKVVEEKLDLVAPIKNIITEDFVVDKVVEEKLDLVAPVENIITEDFVVDKVVEEKLDLVAPVKNIITEDFVVDKLEETIIDFVEPVKNNTEAEPTRSFLKEEEKESIQNDLVASKYTPTNIDFSNVDKIENSSEQTNSEKSTSFVDELAKAKKEEKLLYEQLEEKLNEAKQPQLFQKFNEKENEDVNETFASASAKDSLPKIDIKSTGHFYDNESVMVVDNESETIRTSPTNISTAFNPQILSDIQKSLSESISLNDKFIFVRELFGNNFSDYENALKQIDNLESLESAESYCEQHFSKKFKWNDRQITVERFMELLQNRYESV